MVVGFVDYTNEIGFDCVYAHISGANILILQELDEPYRRMDNTFSKYVLKYGVLVFGSSVSLDRAEIVLSNSTYYNLSELKRIGVLGTGGKRLDGVNLFKHFSIC